MSVSKRGENVFHSGWGIQVRTHPAPVACILGLLRIPPARQRCVYVCTCGVKLVCLTQPCQEGIQDVHTHMMSLTSVGWGGVQEERCMIAMDDRILMFFGMYVRDATRCWCGVQARRFRDA